MPDPTIFGVGSGYNDLMTDIDQLQKDCALGYYSPGSIRYPMPKHALVQELSRIISKVKLGMYD